MKMRQIKTLERHPDSTRLDGALEFDLFALAPPAALAAFLGPVILGLAATLAPAFGGAHAFAALFSDPSLPKAVGVSLFVGLGSTILSVVIAFSACAAFHHHAWFGRAQAFLAPALAAPFASFAVGVAFLVAPSGWIARALSPWATGWREPPDLLTVHDPGGVTLMLALALKECLFLVLMIIAALGQTEAATSVRAARTLGYGPVRAWALAAGPPVYAQLRLPIYAVLAAGLSNVEAAILLGPSAPPTLAPLALSWFIDFSLDQRDKAEAAAALQLALVVGAIIAWRLAEMLVACVARPFAVSGRRSGFGDGLTSAIGALGGGAALVVSFFSGLALLVWSIAERWRWPDGLPDALSFAAWARAAPSLWPLLLTTFTVGAAATGIALVLAVACLEAEQRPGRAFSEMAARRALLLLYAPLLAPQISFLFGVEILWAWLRLDGGWFALVATHLLFVFPYVFLALSDPFRALDRRIGRTAQTLGASRLRALLMVKLPLLVRPTLIAAAVGFSVSVSLYLPTVLAGAGRIATLATETVALASGGDRRIVGVVAFSQMALPFLALALGVLAPDLIARRRRGLRL